MTFASSLSRSTAISRPLRIYPAHSFSHDDDLAELIRLLEPDWVQGRDYVILAPRTHDRLHTGPDNRALAIELLNRMAASDLVWALAGRYATESPWINWENATADVIAKPVVAIAWLGQERLSTVATDNNTRPIARWRKDSVIEASLNALPPQTRAAFLASKAQSEQVQAVLAAVAPPRAPPVRLSRLDPSLNAVLSQIAPKPPIDLDHVNALLDRNPGALRAALRQIKFDDFK